MLTFNTVRSIIIRTIQWGECVEMTDKELKRLSRSELLEMLIIQSKRVDELEKTIQSLEDTIEAQQANRAIIIEESGSIAEAALKLNGIFATAQVAADQYVENVKAKYESLEVEIRAKQEQTDAEILAKLEQADAEIKAKYAKLDSEIEAQYGSVDTDVKTRCEQYEAEVKARCEALEKETKEKCEQKVLVTDEECAKKREECATRCRRMEAETQKRCKDLVERVRLTVTSLKEE